MQFDPGLQTGDILTFKSLREKSNSFSNCITLRRFFM